MASVRKHYENHLASIYLWMAGGIEHALALGASDVAKFLDRPGYAVDLGAGFGMQSIPLARAGFHVLSVDSSPRLLAELRNHADGLNVVTIEGDLQDFAAHMCGPGDLILCMGDTLTHLGSTDEVQRLLRDVAGSLRPGGQFVATFRDYRALPAGDARFIPVRSDAHRILTCFLEERAEYVLVHDVIHELVEGTWSIKVSSYEKLRLSPMTVKQAVEDAGMRCRIETGPRGMIKVVADT